MFINYFNCSILGVFKSIYLRSRLIIVLAISLFFVINSCSGDDPNEDSENGNMMYADASTQYVEFKMPYGYISDVNNIIGIVGSSCDDEIGISLSFPIGVGSYNVSDEGTSATLNWGGCQVIFQGTWDNTYLGLDGTIIVSQFNEEMVSGSFEFEGEDYEGNIRVVSNGYFEIKF